MRDLLTSMLAEDTGQTMRRSPRTPIGLHHDCGRGGNLRRDRRDHHLAYHRPLEAIGAA